MQTYTHYKDSGIDWIGQIPEHWETKKMKYLFIDFSKKNMANETLLSVTQNQGVVPRDWVENRMVMPSGNLESFKYIEKGDFCISLRSFEGGLEYCFHSGLVSPAYTVLKGIFKHYDGYYKYLFKSQIFINELQLSIVGIREGKNISYELLKYDFLPIPPIHEQEAIANFLDDKTAKIDALVQTKEQQIEKLKELRQAKIHQAVTKGLDANAPTKDSGIEWIGDIPEHWKVKKITHLYNQIGSGTTPTSGLSIYYDEGTINYLQTGDLNDGYINDVSKKVTQKALIDFSSLKLYPKGSLVVAMYGATIGKLGILNIETTTNQACCVLGKNSDSIQTKYTFYWFLFAKQNIINMSYGGGQPNISQDLVKSLRLQIPSIQEQEQIVAYLDEVTGKIDQTIAQKQEQITKLKEYKQSLINDVVTGKVKVC